jgi:RNA polymerase sigma factor (TIGR02999 family)
MLSAMSEDTRILNRAQQADAPSAAELLPLVYEELRKLAAYKISQQSPGQTLQATALVHEAWLKLAGAEPARWNDRQHFFRAAAEAMRQILIDRARAKQRLKRGGDFSRVNLNHVALAEDTEPEILLLVDEALQILARDQPEKAELVKLRFYVGLSVAETARALGVSEKTIKRQWIHARARLFQEINRLQRQ